MIIEDHNQLVRHRTIPMFLQRERGKAWLTMNQVLNFVRFIDWSREWGVLYHFIPSKLEKAVKGKWFNRVVMM